MPHEEELDLTEQEREILELILVTEGESSNYYTKTASFDGAQVRRVLWDLQKRNFIRQGGKESWLLLPQGKSLLRREYEGKSLLRRGYGR
jgi:predicted HTH transcriptional regulator